MPDPAAPAKRPYRIDPAVARERSRRGALGRNSPDGYITCLSRVTLTTEQKQRLAVLLMPFLAEQPAGDRQGTGSGDGDG